MGDKIQAKETAKKLGIPVVPGSPGAVTNNEDAVRIARDIGFPVLVKAAAGGGGRGMKVARTEEDLPSALSTARAEVESGLWRRFPVPGEVSRPARATSRYR